MSLGAVSACASCLAKADPLVDEGWGVLGESPASRGREAWRGHHGGRIASAQGRPTTDGGLAEGGVEGAPGWDCA